MASFAALLFLVNVSVVSDSASNVQAAGPQHENSFTVYSANLNILNKDFPRIIRELSDAEADILLLLEVAEDNFAPLLPLVDHYPYHFKDLNKDSSKTGAVLLSKYPIIKSDIVTYSEFGNILVSATLEVRGRAVMFYGAHFPRPEFFNGPETRYRQFVELAEKINGLSMPVIVAGDFNAAPYSPVFRAFAKKSGLKDTREGRGWQPSWPTFFPPLWIPIDHILVSPDIYVHKRATGSYIGSDHYPVIAELSLS